MNESFLFGSPIEPVSAISVNGETGRIACIADWNEQIIGKITHDIDSSIQSGDFVWVSSGIDFELPDNVTVFRILATGSELTWMNYLMHITPSLLMCDSQLSCSSIDDTNISRKIGLLGSLEN